MAQKKYNKKQRKALEHSAQIERTKKFDKPDALPPRTSHYDKKSGVHKSAAEKTYESDTEITYSWKEDAGGENVHIKSKKFMKNEHKARYEGERQYDKNGNLTAGSWTEDCGNHCKINKDKFDEGYDNIFGKRKKGALAGKFKKFKKTY
jgi:hypothetical protein